LTLAPRQKVAPKSCKEAREWQNGAIRAERHPVLRELPYTRGTSLR
jgi:hypothetical protein